MTIADIIAKVLWLFKWVAERISLKDAEDLGRLREREDNAAKAAKQKQAADAARQAVADDARANPDRLRDDDGFRRD